MQESNSNWYHHFWPWFIVLLLVYVVITGIITIYLAFTNEDSLVNDNYYRDGMAINRVIAQDTEALALKLSANVNIDAANAYIVANLHSANGTNIPASQLQLTFIHPIRADADFSVPLYWNKQGNSEGNYRGDWRVPSYKRWYLRLEPSIDNTTDEAAWRLNGEVVLADNAIEVTL